MLSEDSNAVLLRSWFRRRVVAQQLDLMLLMTQWLWSQSLPLKLWRWLGPSWQCYGIRNGTSSFSIASPSRDGSTRTPEQPRVWPGHLGRQMGVNLWARVGDFEVSWFPTSLWWLSSCVGGAGSAKRISLDSVVSSQEGVVARSSHKRMECLHRQQCNTGPLLHCQKIRKGLAKRNQLDKILQPRFVLTDKHDGLRTESHPLPISASSRLVMPGFKDRSNLGGRLRRDATTGSRMARRILFSIAAFFTQWMLIAADIKSAFLKCAADEKRNPLIPSLPGQLCRVLKGIFGLADAPREWWLRLSRAMEEHGWTRTLVDGAIWCLWVTNEAGERTLEALVVAHVDDLLFAGGVKGKASLDAIGTELGFGSLEEGDFTWCGKRIRRASDGTIRLSMREYHENLQEILLPKHRKSDPTSQLDASEARQLRALLGSLQWLVAQLRFHMSYAASALQGEHPPTIATVLKANSIMRGFKVDLDLSPHRFPNCWNRHGVGRGIRKRAGAHTPLRL